MFSVMTWDRNHGGMCKALHTGRMRMRAMITYARGWNALAATRSLGRKGIEVVTGDEYDFAPAGLSKYAVAKFLYPNPDREPEAFLDTLEDAIRAYEPDVLIPIHKEGYLI